MPIPLQITLRLPFARTGDGARPNPPNRLVVLCIPTFHTDRTHWIYTNSQQVNPICIQDEAVDLLQGDTPRPMVVKDLRMGEFMHAKVEHDEVSESRK